MAEAATVDEGKPPCPLRMVGRLEPSGNSGPVLGLKLPAGKGSETICQKLVADRLESPSGPAGSRDGQLPGDLP